MSKGSKVGKVLWSLTHCSTYSFIGLTAISEPSGRDKENFTGERGHEMVVLKGIKEKT